MPPIKNQEDVPLDGGVAEQPEDDGQEDSSEGGDSRSFNLVYSINYVAFVVMGMPLEKFTAEDLRLSSRCRRQ